MNAAHVVYVPVSSLDKIFTFAAGCGAAGATLSDPGGKPGDVAFDDRTGKVYVSDFGKPCIEVYEGGATSPARRLCKRGYFGAWSVAVHGDDVYATMPKPCEDSKYQCFYLVLVSARSPGRRSRTAAHRRYVSKRRRHNVRSQRQSCGLFIPWRGRHLSAPLSR